MASHHFGEPSWWVGGWAAPCHLQCGRGLAAWGLLSSAPATVTKLTFAAQAGAWLLLGPSPGAVPVSWVTPCSLWCLQMQRERAAGE